MRLAHKPVLLLLPLCLSITLASLKFFLSPSYNLRELSGCPLFIYAVFNAVICGILLDNGYRVSENEFEEILPIVIFAYETEEENRAEVTSEKLLNRYEEEASESDSHNNDENKGEYVGSNEDDDDKNGSEYEFGKREGKECELDLEKRIEAFIAKVVNGWREELMI